MTSLSLSISINRVALLVFFALIASWDLQANDFDELADLKRLKSCNSLVMKTCRGLKSEAFGECESTVRQAQAINCESSLAIQQKRGANRGVEKPNISRASVRGNDRPKMSD